jgi:hypothetical protein
MVYSFCFWFANEKIFCSSSHFLATRSVPKLGESPTTPISILYWGCHYAYHHKYFQRLFSALLHFEKMWASGMPANGKISVMSFTLVDILLYHTPSLPNSTSPALPQSAFPQPSFGRLFHIAEKWACPFLRIRTQYFFSSAFSR